MALLAARVAAGQVNVDVAFDSLHGPAVGSVVVSNPDSHGGVGPNHVVSISNFGVEMDTKAGAVAGAKVTLPAFWASAGLGTVAAYDPRLSFDPLSNRWFATSLSASQTNLYLGVSKGEDPTQGWDAVSVLASGTDNDKFAVDNNGFYWCALTATANRCWAIPKRDLLATPPTGANMVAFGVVGSLLGIHPASDWSPKKLATDPEWLILRDATATETTFDLFTITWAGDAGAPTFKAVGSVGLGMLYPIKPTTAGVQPDGGLILEYGESRLNNAVLANGSLWTICETEVNGRDGFFWVQIDVSGAAPKLVQQGSFGDSSYDMIYPAIGVNESGDVGIGVIRSSATEFPSIYVMGRKAADPPGSLRAPVLGKAGTADYACNGKAQLGDYSIAWPDPLDPTRFWYHDAYANNPASCAFGTAWIEFDLGGMSDGDAGADAATPEGGATDSGVGPDGRGEPPSDADVGEGDGPGMSSATGESGSGSSGGCACRQVGTGADVAALVGLAGSGIATLIAGSRRRRRNGS
jgi:hypothetical protein